MAWALLFYASSLIGLAAIEIIARAFYAMEDTWTPVLVGALQLIAMWIIGLWLSKNIFPALGWLQFGALALAYSISAFLELVLLLYLLRRKMGGLDSQRLFTGVWRMVFATLIMGVITWFAITQMDDLGLVWQLLLGGLVGAASYFFAALGMGVKEMRQLAAYGQDRFRNRKRT